MGRQPGVAEFELAGSGAAGWEHFLASLAAYAETGTGTPLGT